MQTMTQPKITDYRQLMPHEAELMNKIKAKGQELQVLVEEIREHLRRQDWAAIDAKGSGGDSERFRLLQAQPERWVSIGTRDLQTGLMALTRAVAQPSTF